MIPIVQRNSEVFRGSLRLGTTIRSSADSRSQSDFTPSSEGSANQTTAEPSWLAESLKLIPGEALAGYLSLQALGKFAQNPANVNIFIALVFCFVTVVLRWFGTQDPTAPKPSHTVQWTAIIISTLSYILLVYSSGGQIFWHQPITDQKLYAQILSVALVILGPTVYKAISSSK